MPDARVPPPTFDLEAVYESEICPLMQEVADACKAAGIPVLAAFCYQSDEEDYCLSRWALGRDGWLPDGLREARLALSREAELIRKGPI